MASVQRDDSTIEADLDELSSLLAETFRALKESSPPPPEMIAAAKAAGLSPRHMPAILAVAATGPMSVSELARRLGLSLSATSAIVGALSRAGLLVRTEDESDRRRTIVAVDEQMRGVVEPWAERALAPLRLTLERLPADVRAHFLQGLRLLHEQVTASATGDGAAPEA